MIQVSRPRELLVGVSPIRTFYEIQTQLVMLDLLKPMKSGVDVCRQIRSMSDALVVSLSGVEDVEFGKELLAPPPVTQPQQTAAPGMIRTRSWQVRVLRRRAS